MRVSKKGKSVLDLKHSTLIAVSCDLFDSGRLDTNTDCLNIEWCESLAGALLRHESFQSDDMICRKNMTDKSFQGCGPR